MGYSHLSSEEIKEIINDLANNISYNEIIEKYNIDRNACSALAKQYGITQIKRKKRLELNKRVIELYNQGYNYSEIGRICGCTHSSVTQILDRHGIKRKHNKRSEDILKRNEKIISLYQTGQYTQPELGEMFNLSYTYVGVIINQTLNISNDDFLDARDNKVNELINNGKTNLEISKELNVPKMTIASNFINQNYRKRIKERNEEIFKLHQSGDYTKKELAEMFNLSRQTISTIISKYKNNIK